MWQAVAPVLPASQRGGCWRGTNRRRGRRRAKRRRRRAGAVGAAGAPERGALPEREAWALGGLGLDLAHGLFQRQPLAGNFGFAQRRLHAAQLPDQRLARPHIERAAALAGGTGVQSGNGAGNQRVVISHLCSTLGAFR